MSDQITTTIIFLSSTQTAPTGATSADFRPTSTSSLDSGVTSFVGNTPATVLFFLALGVGIFIGSLFIFFTLRYFVRARYGLNVYSISRRNIMLSSMDSLQNIDDQWEFIRMHHDYLLSRLRDRTLTRSGNIITLSRRSRRRRNARFSKMKKLTIEEVEELFPKITYENWLSSGKKDYTNILQEEEENGVEEMQEVQDIAVLRNSIELTDITPVLSTPKGNLPKHLSLSNSSLNRLDSLKSFEPNKPETSVPEQDIYDLANPHYTSGSCAICLEIIEDDDEVRGLMCGHVFHAECLDPWLTKRRACCPMCKRDYYKNETNQGTSATNENDMDLGEGASNNGTSNNHANNTNTNENNNNTRANENTNAEPNANERSNTTEANNDSDGEGDSFDFETFRSDPVIRAMLQELIPPAERVRLILADEGNAGLHFDETAHRIADQKFDNIFKRLWWRLMGISKDDLYYWAVVDLYNNHRLEQALNQLNNEANEQREGTEAQPLTANHETPNDNDNSSNSTNNDNSSTNNNNNDTASNGSTNLEAQEIVNNANNSIHTRSDTPAPSELPYSPVTDDSGHDYIHRHV